MNDLNDAMNRQEQHSAKRAEADPSQPPAIEPFLLRELVAEGEAAYDVLGQFGVAYDASMSELNRQAQLAQRQLTSRHRKAWQQLRDAEQRLAIDLLYVQ